MTQRRKRIDMTIDLALGLGLPVVIMALSYVVQPHRYDIFEGFGCEYPVWSGVLAIFLVHWWTVLLGVISAGFGSEW
jgi:pheromone a factor receptor